MNQIAELLTGALLRAGYLEGRVKGPPRNGGCPLSAEKSPVAAVVSARHSQIGDPRCGLTRAGRADSISYVFVSGVDYANAMLRLRQNPRFRTYYLPCPQRSFKEVLSKPPENQDSGEWNGQACSRLHAMPALWKGSEGLTRGLQGEHASYPVPEQMARLKMQDAGFCATQARATASTWIKTSLGSLET